MLSTVQATQGQAKAIATQQATKATMVTPKATASQTRTVSLQPALQSRQAMNSAAAFTHVDFTKAGWKQFCKANHGIGTRFIRAFILKRELAAYLAAHDQAGVHLDTDCQEVRYEDGVYLLLRRMHGTWYITDVSLTEAPTSFAPVFVWTIIRHGVARLLASVLACWRDLTGKQVAQS